MTTLTIDTKAGRIKAEVDIDSVEAAGDAIVAIKGAARALWPGILFPGEPGFDGDEASEPRRGGAHTWRSDWRPKPGSLADRIMPDALAGKSVLEIADAHDATTQAVGGSLARLRRAGLLDAATEQAEGA